MAPARLPDPSGASLITAAVAGAVAAITVPGEAAGVNLFSTALCVGLAESLARPARLSREVVMLSVSAIALAATPVLRAAEWLVAVNVLLSCFLGCAAVAGDVSWPGLVKSLAAPAARLPVVPAILARKARRRGREESRPGLLISALRAVALAGVLLLAFGVLFVSADAAFAHLAEELAPRIHLDGWTVVRAALFLAVFAGTVALAVAGSNFQPPPKINRLIDAGISAVAPPTEGGRRLIFRLRPSEWLPGLIALLVLFALFVGVQLTVLFGGHDHVLRTAGLTYAEYAREGFAQLLAASALSLLLLAGANLGFDRPGRRWTSVFRALSALLCLLTLVVLSSALHRLGLYEQAFGFTRLRLLGHTAILWLAAVLASLLCLGAAQKLDRLPAVVIWLSVSSALCLTALNPDDLIARRNSERFIRTGKLDIAYLSTLSADALRGLRPLPPRLEARIVGSISARLDREEPWTSWNLARARAREASREAP